jgi:hypothetical protein
MSFIMELRRQRISNQLHHLVFEKATKVLSLSLLICKIEIILQPRLGSKNEIVVLETEKHYVIVKYNIQKHRFEVVYS